MENSDRLWPRLRAIARREGLTALGGARLAEPAHGFSSCLSLAAALSPAVMAEVAASQAPTMTYYHHYRTANALLDRAAFLLAGVLSEAGFRALPVPSSQTVDRRAQAALFPHKTAAVLAGLGWIGRGSVCGVCLAVCRPAKRSDSQARAKAAE